MKQKRYMALDFGVGHGVAMLGTFDGESIGLEPMHRFPVRHTRMLGTGYWDFPAMMIHAKTGLDRCSARHGARLDGIACDAWNADFGLLDKTGHLLANPVHHHDARTHGAVERLHAIFPDRSLYQRTGVRARREGTLFQLFAMAQANSPLLDKAVTVLLMADLVSYFLTGTPVQEYTLATTTGMYDAENRDWSRDIILGAKIPPGMAPEIVAPGTVIGSLLDEVAGECGLGPVPVIAPASHGMAGAIAAVPARGEDWLCISSGFWSQVVAELPGTVINDAGFSMDFSNLGGVDGCIRLQKEVLGMGVLDGLVRAWSREDGRDISVDEAIRLAEKAPSMERFINPSDPRLVDASDTPALLNTLLRESGQAEAADRGGQVRLFIESVVLALRHAAGQLRELTGRTFSVIHFVGRGVDSPFIAQSLADATGMVVKAGPVEAKAVGNIVMQMIALGDVGSLAEARELVGKSFEILEYEPRETERWDRAYEEFRKHL
jgi:sugar (pentulose or hexulose) kinase